MKRIIAVVATVAVVAATAQTPDAFEQFRRQMDSSFESVRNSNNETFERQRAEIDKSFADHMRKAWEVYNSSPSVPEPKRPEPVTIPKYVPSAPTSNEHPVTVVESVPKVEPVQPIIAPKPAPAAPVVAPKPAPAAPVVAPKPAPAAPVVEPKPQPTAPVAKPEPKPEPKAPVTEPKQTPTTPVVEPKPQPTAPVAKPEPKPEPKAPVTTPEPKPEPKAPVTEPKQTPTAPVVEPKPAPAAPVVAPKPAPAAPVVTPKPQPTCPKQQPTCPNQQPTCPNQRPTCPNQQPVAPVVAPKPQPTAPVVVPSQQPTASNATTAFDYFGTKVVIRVPGTAVPSLFDVSEGNVADTWMSMGSGEYEQTLADCLAARSKMALGDWGYYRLVQKFTKCYYEADCNDAVLLQAYLMAHSGYRVRMARSGNQLVLLLNITGQVYGMSYFTIDGHRFYKPEKGAGSNRMNICGVKFPGENSLSLGHTCPPRFEDKSLPVKHFASKRYPEANIDLRLNGNLMEYYKDYPSTDFVFYVRTSVSEGLKAQLYPMLKRVTAGKSQKDAVEILLNFVQTSFEYKTDDQQFGREKWFFGDEIFFYPYSDCDDRAIFFSILVRDVLNMEAVLLDYPGHLAAAVRFDSAVEGDYVMYGQKRFVVCDPTYIGAGVGKAMPNLDTKGLKLIQL